MDVTQIHQNYLTIAAVLIGGLLVWWQTEVGRSQFRRERIERRLEKPRGKEEVRRELLGPPNAFERYLDGVGRLNGRFDEWFGPPWSGQAFYRCFQIAFIYPIALLVAAWVAGMPGSIGNFELLPNQPPLMRMLSALILLVLAGGFYFFISREVPQRLGRLVGRFVSQIV